MKKFLIYIFLIFALFSFHLISYSKSIEKELANNVIRLHVIANSDNKEDQNVKIIVRDNVLNYINSLKLDDLPSSRKAIKENIENIKSIVNTTLSELSCNYTAEVYFGNFRFPAKKYDDITLPSGTYESVKIILRRR
jgi:stage II sporulation protein R